MAPPPPAFGALRQSRGTARVRAAVLSAPRSLHVEERAAPSPAGGGVVVRVAATAICHTDLEIYTGRHPGVRYPVVMGHEATGIVESVGEDVTGVEPGDRVLINPIVSCGSCDSCMRGRRNLCRRAGLLGRESDGALTDRLAVPASLVHRLPPHLPLDAATLIETLATVRHAQARAGIATGDAVVVLGQGTAGLMHTRLAKLAGAGPVVAVSRSAWKLEIARRFGADQVIDAGTADLVPAVLDATEGRGADVVIDAVGSAALVVPAIEMLRPGGKLLLYGVSHARVDGFSTFPIYFKELTLYGARALTAADVPGAVDLIASGAVDVSGFITASYPLADVAAAFEAYEANPERILRLVVVPDA